MAEKYLKLNDIDAYKIAFHLSNYVWNVVIKWENFPRRTVGEQFVDATDSISANMAEGFGRYFKKDKIKFYFYSAGSVKECFDWNEKSKLRLLLTKEEYSHIFEELQKLPEAINRLIKYTNLKLNK
jgi:four helix bundle protein